MSPIFEKPVHVLYSLDSSPNEARFVCGKVVASVAPGSYSYHYNCVGTLMQLGDCLCVDSYGHRQPDIESILAIDAVFVTCKDCKSKTEIFERWTKGDIPCLGKMENI